MEVQIGEGHPLPKSVHGKSSIVKRSVVINGHKTSLSVEDEFWAGLKNIAAGKEVTLGGLIGDIDANREAPNLSSAVRLFVLNYYMERASAARYESCEKVFIPVR